MTPDDIEREAEEHYAKREASVPFNLNVLRGLFHGAAGLTSAERWAGLLAVERIANAQPGNDAAWTPARPGDTPGQLIPGESDVPQPIDLSTSPREPRRWAKIDKPDDDDLPQVIDVEGYGRWRRHSVEGVLYTDGMSATTMGELMTWGDVTEVLGDA